MVRLIGFFAGLTFMFVLLWGAAVPREAPQPDITKKYFQEPREAHWQTDGPLGLGVFGTFDRAQLQRGFQVYKEVCSACHGLTRVAYRNLGDLGFSAAQVKALAKQGPEVPSINEKTGEPATRKALPSDQIPSPYPNEIAGRAANNNALPPDLSLITKAREGGARYVYSLLTGYRKAPADVTTPPNLYYNPWFHSLNVAMPPPLKSAGQISYTDGTKGTVDQYAKDVAAFLTWTAEPMLERRRQAGVIAIVFLLIMTGFAYVTYRRVWAELKKA